VNALIFKIDRLNTHNGPGFRTVIYLKGCPLHCSWCHNPEGISPKKEVWLNATKCIGCRTCVEMCPVKALNLTGRGISIDRTICIGCQLCAMVCPAEAIDKIGKEYSVDDLMKLILQDKFLFESSGGGITATGGEPGNHPDFIAELFQRCQEEGIHTAFDTSGMVPESALEKVAPFTDMVFLDIKTLDPEKSIRHTGIPVPKLREIIGLLNHLQEKQPKLKIEIRTPLIPGITDDTESLLNIGHFIQQELPSVKNWELCLFNNLCEDKYNQMHRKWELHGKMQNRIDYQRFSAIQEEFKDLNILVAGFLSTDFGKPQALASE
jgi:pyruvate formate lyase activating enzyme